MFRHYALFHLKTSRLLHSALILLSVALILFCGTFWEDNRYAWTPVDMALPLEQALDLNVSFIANTPRPTYYYIQIAAESNLPPEKIDEALAQIGSGLKCQVSSNVGAVKKAEYRGASYGTTVAQTIDTFEGVPGRRYTIRLRGKAIPQNLRILHPRLKAAVSPSAWEPHMISTTLLFMAASLLGLLGFICLCGSCLRLIISYHKRGAPKPAS